ncbi:rCG46320 [Rattus norvegicus]|nr:rCG46320 [Rattus norvegicus]
MLQRKCV